MPAPRKQARLEVNGPRRVRTAIYLDAPGYRLGSRHLVLPALPGRTDPTPDPLALSEVMNVTKSATAFSSILAQGPKTPHKRESLDGSAGLPRIGVERR